MSEDNSAPEIIDQDNIILLIDLGKDEALHEMVSEAVTRINNPTDEEKNNNLTKPEILLRFMTQESRQFSDPQRKSIMDEDGNYKPNPKFNKEEVMRSAKLLQEIKKMYIEKGKPVFLGTFCAMGELCFGQSLFASVVLEKVGIKNQVIRLDPEGDDPNDPAHAVVVFEDSNKKVQYFDSMDGRIYDEEKAGDAYSEFSYVSLIRS